MIIIVVIIISEAWLKSHGKPCESSSIELGLRGLGQVLEGRNSVSGGMGIGNHVLCAAIPRRWEW